MKNLITLAFIFLMGFSVVKADGPSTDELMKKAISVVDEAARRSYSQQDSTEAKKISYAAVMPAADEKNVVITFTINTDNKIHVVDIKGGYAFLTHYIKTSLEGQEIKTESAIPGINYVMAIKLPASA